MKAPLWILTLVMVFLSQRVGFAQFSPGGITGGGNVVLRHKPDTMRMQIDITGQGTTLKDALDVLKTRRQAALKRLGELGAAKESIHAGDAKVAPPDPRQRQIQMMARQRMMAGGKRGKKAEPATPPLVVTTTLTAEWPVKAADADELLLLVGTLQAKIRKSDLGGNSEATKLSPEEQELMEESETTNFDYGGEEQAKPGDPRFVFVKKISADEQAEALARAFKQAKEEAAKLAKAADLDLGALKYLQSTTSTSEQVQQYAAMYGYSRYGRGMMAADPNLGDPRNEAIGPQSEEVTYTVTVSASFEAK